MEDQSYRLIVEYFEKTINDDGLTQLQEWIEADSENLEKFRETIQILEASKLYFKQPEQSEQTERSWAHIHAHVTGKENSVLKAKQKLQWLAYAAVCLVIALSALWYKQIFRNFPVEYAEISNPDGQHSRVLLPDSSVVYLGGGSRLKYARAFPGRKRIVYLNGEAFFEVVHEAKRPFIVKSGDISTIVLGTSFNVKAFTAEKKVAVTVQTGKVGVMAIVHGKSQLVKYLTPNEQIEINTQSGLYTFGTVDAERLSGWINNNFIFYNTPLKEIVASLEHQYGAKIEFTDSELGNIRLTAEFKDIPLKQVMEDISALSGLAYTQKDNQFFISNNDQKGGKIMK